jgi:hypothetical protein
MARDTKDKREAEDDVEGHVSARRAPDGVGTHRREGEGLAPVRRITGDENDVEGHGGGAQRRGPDGIGGTHRREGEGLAPHRRITGDDDDVEGHSFGRGGNRGE